MIYNLYTLYDNNTTTTQAAGRHTNTHIFVYQGNGTEEKVVSQFGLGVRR